jgi:hypothetical protein
VWLGRIIVLCNHREATKMWVVIFHRYGLFLILGQSRPISVYIFYVNIMLNCWHVSQLVGIEV